MTDEPKSSPEISVSKRGTIIVRLKRTRQLAAVRWVRGVLITGVAAGVLAAVRYLWR